MRWKKVAFYVLITIFEAVFLYCIMNASYNNFIYREKVLFWAVLTSVSITAVFIVLPVVVGKKGVGGKEL